MDVQSLKSPLLSLYMTLPYTPILTDSKANNLHLN